MRNLKTILTIGMGVLISLSVYGVALAGGGGTSYKVTIYNLTKGQPLTPPLVVSHKGSYKLFMPGHAASPELATLAETGSPEDLMTLLSTEEAVFDYMAGGGLILPGESMAVEVQVKGQFRHLSVVSMLAGTNDAFLAIDGARAPWFGQKALTAIAYDAGSEANTEKCTDVPALPCDPQNDTPQDNPNNRVTVGSEGYISVHNGIHGTGMMDGVVSLIAANMDWRNPVAKVMIEKMKN